MGASLALVPEPASIVLLLAGLPFLRFTASTE
jgi:hypothetical protein